MVVGATVGGILAREPVRSNLQSFPGKEHTKEKHNAESAEKSKTGEEFSQRTQRKSTEVTEVKSRGRAQPGMAVPQEERARPIGQTQGRTQTKRGTMYRAPTIFD
jgi:hypothetical protein